MTRSLKCRLWAWPGELRRSGVLGLNARNLRIILKHNPRIHYPAADDKLLTKQICRRHGIPVPETYGIIEKFGDIKRLPRVIADRNQFVVKPAQGAGGRGVLVIVGRDDCVFEDSDGNLLSIGDLTYHVATTLSGLFSMDGRQDRVIIEQRIFPHPCFSCFGSEGTPDIRIMTYRGTPLMAMMRVPTQASRGRANLHQGAVGAGIDLRTGRTSGGVCRCRRTTVHPDTGLPVGGMLIPYWQDVLKTALGVTRAVEMGYLGIDLALDAERGPVVLEVNARPGLDIQIANSAGLWRGIERVDALDRAAAEEMELALRPDRVLVASGFSPEVTLGS